MQLHYCTYDREQRLWRRAPLWNCRLPYRVSSLPLPLDAPLFFHQMKALSPADTATHDSFFFVCHSCNKRRLHHCQQHMRCCSICSKLSITIMLCKMMTYTCH